MNTLIARTSCRTHAYHRASHSTFVDGETVSESGYAHAETIWQRFDIRTLREYSDLYLKTDVLLLADIFEIFRKGSIKSYGLDAAHYYTLPGFTWENTPKLNSNYSPTSMWSCLLNAVYVVV